MHGKTVFQDLANRRVNVYDENASFLLCHGNAAIFGSPETAVQPGQREPEGAAFADFAFDTDTTSVRFDGQFAEG